VEGQLPVSGEDSSHKIKSSILKIIARARRSGVWNKMDKVDRGILELSSRLEIKFRSLTLLRSIAVIAKKIAEISSFTYRNYVLGMKTAYKMAEYAVQNGYAEAADWVKEKHFIVWWGIFISPRTYTK
jgi:hypothetical protein